jgi:hypothetical protein
VHRVSQKNRCIVIDNKEGYNKDDNKILLRIQGANLRRALTSKYEEAPLDNCTTMLQLQETHVKT